MCIESHGGISVVNVRGMTPDPEGRVVDYIGFRSGKWKQSVLRNRKMRYKMRGEIPDNTLPDYRLWLWKQIKYQKQDVIIELLRLAWKVKNGQWVLLGCWCAPHP